MRAARETADATARELAAIEADRDAERDRALDAFDGERHEWHASRARLEEEARRAAERAEALDRELASVRSQLDAD